MFYRTREFTPQEVKEEVQNTISNEYASRALDAALPELEDMDAETEITLNAEQMREVFFKGYASHEQAAAKIDAETERATPAALDYWNIHKNWIPTEYDELMQVTFKYLCDNGLPFGKGEKK